MKYFYFAVECFTSFVECFIFLLLGGLIIGKKKTKQKIFFVILFSLIATAAVLFLNSVNLYSYLTALIWIVMMSAILFFIFRSGLLQSLALSSVYLVAINAVDFLLLSIIELLFSANGLTLEIMTAQGVYRSVFVLSVKILLIAFYLVLRTRKDIKLVVDNKISVILLFTSAFSFFCMQYLIGAVVGGQTEIMRKSVMIAWIFIILSIVCFVKILSMNINYTNEKIQKSIIETRLSSVEAEVNEREAAYNQMAKITHDYKNQILTLSSVAHKNGYDKLFDYLDELSENSKQYYTDKTRYTGVEVADTLIWIKANEAKNKNIEFIIDCVELVGNKISPADLSAVLGNLLDNAIEACETIKGCIRKFVKLNIKTINSMIVISVVNTIDGSQTVKQKGGKLVSTKHNTDIHGYGTQIIDSIADKYNGTFDYHEDGETFTASVILND